LYYLRYFRMAENVVVAENDQVTKIEENVEEKMEEKSLDEGSNLNRGEYSSEFYKIELKNLPKSFGFGVRLLLFNIITLKGLSVCSSNSAKIKFFR
jgi:hypothetical protein